MPSATSHLSELHQLLRQLEEVREKIARGPRVVAAARRRVAEREAELAGKRAALAELRKAAAAKSGDLKVNESRILNLRTKLNQATSNREFDVIKGQVDADEMANSVLEDEILEMYEKIDAAERVVTETVEHLARDEADAKKTAERVASAAGGLAREAAGLEAAVAGAEKGLANSLVDKYRRLVAAHGAGALAPVEGEVCSACYVSIESQLRVELKSGRPVFCRNCGRLLYRDGDGD